MEQGPKMEQEPMEQHEGEELKTYTLEQNDVDIVQVGLDEYLKSLKQRLEEEQKFPVNRQNTPMIDHLNATIQNVSELKAKLGQ